MHMHQVIPHLWIGDIQAAHDYEELQRNQIHSVLSAMRGSMAIHPTFTTFQAVLDDEDDADILQHLVPAIAFIQAELEKNRGVLVHCQAGVSRSATIVSAYLMFSRNINADTALEMIREVRPWVSPNDGFIYQLDVFYHASFKISQSDKTTRMFYLERAVNEIMNGEGLPQSNMFPNLPHNPVDSTPVTPGHHIPRRRIRCRMCRQELAAREHMLGHGNIGPPTPATAMALSPAVSRRGSMDPSAAGNARRPSFTPVTAGATGPSHQPRRPSMLAKPVGLTMTTMDPADTAIEDDDEEPEAPKSAPAYRSRSGPTSPTAAAPGSGSHTPLSAAAMAIPPATRARLGSASAAVRPPAPRQHPGQIAMPEQSAAVLAAAGAPPPEGETAGATLGRQLSESLTALEQAGPDGECAIAEDDEDEDGEGPADAPRARRGSSAPTTPLRIVTPRSRLGSTSSSAAISRRPSSGAASVARRPSAPSGGRPAAFGLPAGLTMSSIPPKDSPAAKSGSASGAGFSASPKPMDADGASPGSGLPMKSPSAAAPQTPNDLAAQLMANPKLAALRSPGAGTPSVPPIQTAMGGPQRVPPPPSAPPILTDQKCSGYFLEPMKWMEPFLEGGQLAGKITCPNKKCGAKLGNYDWAGVRCSCKEWVVPGFCIHRSKVDEYVI